MTLPGIPGGRDEGAAFIRLEVDADNLPEDMKLAVEKAALEAERTEGPIAGQHIGKGVGTGIEKELEKPAHGSGIARAVERSLKDEHVDSSHLFANADRDAEHVARDVARDFAQAFEDAILSGGSGGNGQGPFGFIKQSIQDALGAGFNVPGKSPLIALLVPVFGALADVIGSALEALQGLAALLTTIPTLLSAISLEAGTLYLIFHSTFSEFKNAYNATNAKEFQKAIEGLTLPAQKFATEFIPAIHKFFHDLEFYAQYNFFWRLGSIIIPGVVTQLTRELGPAVAQIASGFGYLFEQIGIFLSNQDVAKFIKDIGVAAGNFVADLAPALVKLLDGFVKFADAMIPFTNKIGAGLLNLIGKFGDWLGKIADDPKFQKWLEDMLPIIAKVGDVLAAAGDLIISFFDALNQAGGSGLLDTLVNSLLALAAFFQSDVGIMFLKTLIELIELLTYIFVGLVVIVGSLISILGAAWDAIVFIAKAIANWFGGLDDAFDGFKKNVENFFNSWVSRAAGFPLMIKNAIGDLGQTLVHAGESLITGFIHGIENMVPNAVDAAKSLLSDIRDLFPFSPAKKGPLSGKGHTYFSGQALVKDFARGMNEAAGIVSNASANVVSNVVFGPGSVSVSFEGSEPPTPEEARVTGSAVGAGISQQLANRDAALAVRTL